MSAKKKNTNLYKDLLISILIIGLYFIWPYIVNSIVKFLNIDSSIVLYGNFTGNMIFTVIAIIVYRDTLKKDIKKFNKNIFKNIGFSLKWTLLALVLFLLINQILYFIFPNIEQENTNLILDMFKDNKTLLILNTLLYYSLVEEMVFKIPFKKFLKNKWLFILITGFINAFFTVYLSATSKLSLVFIISYTVLIGCFSYVYYKKDTIVSSMLSRMLYNLITIIVLMS